MFEDTKIKQIKALLNFDTTKNMGSLIVDREDVYFYVKEHGLPRNSQKSGEFSYRFHDGSWIIDYFEKGCNIGSQWVETEEEVLDVVLSSAMISYKRWNN